MKRSIIFVGTFLLITVFLCSNVLSKKIVLRAQSSYPPGLPQLYAPAKHFCELISKLTDGEVEVKLYPSGAIVPAKQVLDAVNSGIIDMGFTWAGWWQGKFPAAPLFGNSYPNGMQMSEMLGWIFNGGGLELWNEMYRQKGYNVVVLPPYGMLGSENFAWSKKPIRSLKDFKGLKFRTVGIWGKCLEKLGAHVVSLSGGEVYPALERGVIDACEFATPAIDKKLGFQDICPYLIVPGIHEPCAPLETLMNKNTWNRLPDRLKEKIKVALKTSCFDAINKALKQDAEAMQYFLSNPKLKVSKLTPKMIEKIKEIGQEVMEEIAKKDAFFKKVWYSQVQYRKKVEPYASLIRLPYPYAGK